MKLYVYISAVFASFAAFIFGYDVGSMSGVKDMVGYRETFNLSYHSGYVKENASQSCSFKDDVETSAILGLIISLYSVGGLVGALAGGGISEFWGRKPSLLLGSSVVALGGLIHTSAVYLWMVLLSRIITGLGVGIIYQVVPIYVGEIAPERYRGRLLSLLNIYASLGYLLGFILNIIVKDLSYGWRISVSIELLVGVVSALATMLIPRSPRWLVQKGREDEALKVLHQMYKDENIAKQQLITIKLASSSNMISIRKTIKYILQWKVLQRVMVVFMVFLLGRFCGGTFIGYFAVSIFCKIGLQGFVAALLPAVAVVTIMLISLSIIDKIGRKPPFLIGLTVVFATLVLSSVFIIVFDLDRVDSNEVGGSLKVVGYVILVLLSLNIGWFSFTCGNLPYIITGELFPLPAKGFIAAISNTGFWIGLSITNELGPILISSSLRVPGTLLLFSANSVLLFLLVLFFIPETQKITLEEVDKLYSLPWKDRIDVIYYLKCCCFVQACERRGTVERNILEPEVIEDELCSLSSISSADLTTNLVTTL